MSDLIATLGTTFLISSFIPALVFAFLNFLLFALASKTDIGSCVAWPSEHLTLTPWVVLILTIAGSYVLTSLDNRIINLYQGYPLLRFGRFMEWERRRWYKRKQQVEELGEEACNEETKDEDYYWEYRKELGRFRRYYPMEMDYVMPTRLGNIFAAHQNDCQDKYGIDPIVIWPLLRPAVSEEYLRLLDINNTLLQFLLNLSLLSFAFSGEVLTCIFVGEVMACPALARLPQLCIVSKALLFGLPLLAGIGLYYLSLPIARTYADYLFACVTLFRHQLLKQLCLRFPGDIEEERRIWRQAIRFFSTGEGDPFGQFIFGNKQEGQQRTLYFPLKETLVTGLAVLVLLILLKNGLRKTLRLLQTRRNKTEKNPAKSNPSAMLG